MEERILGEEEVNTLDIIILEEEHAAFQELYKEYENDLINSQELYHEKPRVFKTEAGLICTNGIKSVKKQIALRKERINVIMFVSTTSHAMLTRLAVVERHFKIGNMAKANIYHDLRNKQKIRTTEIAEAIGRTNQYVFQRLDMLEYPEILWNAYREGVVTFSQARRYFNEYRKYGDEIAIMKRLEKMLEIEALPSTEPT